MKDEVMKTDDGDELVAGPVLTPMESLFVSYFSDPESETYSRGTASAKKAGFSQPHSAQWKLRRRARVREKIEEWQVVSAAAVGRVMTDLEHIRQRALLEGGAAGLAVACRAVELMGKHVAAFADIVRVDVGEKREWDEKRALESSRIARLLIEQDGDRLLGLPVPGEPALEGKTVGPAALGALPEPKPAQERNG